MSCVVGKHSFPSGNAVVCVTHSMGTLLFLISLLYLAQAEDTICDVKGGPNKYMLLFFSQWKLRASVAPVSSGVV